MNHIVETFLPREYFSNLSRRLNVTAFPLVVVETHTLAMTDALEQLAVVHDLLVIGLKREISERTRMVALAAKLLTQIKPDYSHEFVAHLSAAPKVSKVLAYAFSVNCFIHTSMEELQRGSSGLNPSQLALEQTFFNKLNKNAIYRQPFAPYSPIPFYS